MKGSARRRRSRLLFLLGLLIVGVALVAGTAHAARTNQDLDANRSFGRLYQGSPTQDCWKHHKPEGMTDSHVVIPIIPKAVRQGEAAELQIQVENSWKYDIAELQIKLNLTGDGTYLVPLVGSAADSTPPYTNKWTGTVGNPNAPRPPPNTPVPSPPARRGWHNFTIGPEAVAFIAHGEIYYPPGTGTALPHQASFFYRLPGRTQLNTWSQEKTATDYNVTLTTVPPGEWSIGFTYENGDASQVSYAIDLTVLYRSAGASEVVVFEQLRNPPNPPTKPAAIIPPRGVSDVITVPILGVAPGEQDIEVNVTALLYYKHQAGGTPNEDWFYRIAKAKVVVGDEFIGSDVEATTGGTVEVDLYMMSGEVTGFAAAFLLLPSLLLGGTYGRASRKFLNDVLGGAKRRVMFHNLVSLGLTLVALVHIVFFLLEVRYTVLMGVLFGGLGALCLLILGLTGYYQVPLIQKYGYNWWRYLHLAVGLLVVVFVSYHAIADGPDFFFLKEQLPQWLNDVNSAQK